MTFVLIIDTPLKVYYVINIHENMKIWPESIGHLIYYLLYFLLYLIQWQVQPCVRCSLNGSIRLLILRIDDESFVNIYEILFEIS